MQQSSNQDKPTQAPLTQINSLQLKNEEYLGNEQKLEKGGRSKTLRRVSKKRTPSEILKDNILKNKYNKRVNDLRTVTSENIKLFMRLQDQKSAYNFNSLHSHLSCTILPLAKSKITVDKAKQFQQEKSISKPTHSRCSSAFSLKLKCDSIKQTLLPKRISLKSDANTQMHTSRSSKVSVFMERKDKQNIEGNNPIGELRAKQQKLLLKKMGLKLSIDRSKLHATRLTVENAVEKTLSTKLRPLTSMMLKPSYPKGFLTERKLQRNMC